MTLTLDYVTHNIYETLQEQQPATANSVINILEQHSAHGHDTTHGDAFFEWQGAISLMEMLYDIGWTWNKTESEYYWVMLHPATAERITYIEGDVYAGDKM